MFHQGRAATDISMLGWHTLDSLCSLYIPTNVELIIIWQGGGEYVRKAVHLNFLNMYIYIQLIQVIDTNTELKSFEINELLR